VIDSGIGIAADEIDKIQEPFYRASPLLHPQIKGNGLGLSIVKRMCQLMQIQFKIKSEIGHGTTAELLF
jgi:signal transduction histidine kinase